MSGQESLICPRSGDECAYYHFCASRKEIVDERGVHLASPVGNDYSKLPPETVAVLMSDEWCSDARISALTAIVRRSSAEQPDRVAASLIASMLTAARNQIIGTAAS